MTLMVLLSISKPSYTARLAAGVGLHADGTREIKPSLNPLPSSSIVLLGDGLIRAEGIMDADVLVIAV